MNRPIYPFALALLLAVPAVAAQQQDIGHAQAATRTAKDAVDRPHCLQHTGSRILPSRHARRQQNAAAREHDDARDCLPTTGRAYSRGDINATGAVDLGDALRRLDPAIR